LGLVQNNNLEVNIKRNHEHLFAIIFPSKTMLTLSIQNPKILVPLDFSRCSEYALDYAKAIVKPLNGSLHLLHVIDPPAEYSEWGYTFAQDVVAGSYQRAEEEMKRTVESLTKAGVAVSSEIITGTPYYAIANYADEREMDLLIISTHGRHGFERFLMGSTTERVLRTAHCPVLSVHPPHEYLKANKPEQIAEQSVETL
jgi:nucleotide-binding universal stress UspA family protein